MPNAEPAVPRAPADRDRAAPGGRPGPPAGRPPRSATGHGPHPPTGADRRPRDPAAPPYGCAGRPHRPDTPAAAAPGPRDPAAGPFPRDTAAYRPGPPAVPRYAPRDPATSPYHSNVPAAVCPDASRPARGAWSASPWAARVLTWLGLALVPWVALLPTGVLDAAAGGHAAWTWTGLDALECAGLLATGRWLRRADPRAALSAVATATLLLADAWFDTTTASGSGRILACVLAACPELPLAAGCALIAARVLLGPRGRPAP